MDLAPYAASVFAPHLFSGQEQMGQGCGATALALITGIPPSEIQSEHKRRHFSDTYMARFLRDRGYQVKRLTPLSICGARTKIASNHVLLVSQLFRRLEATWGVIYSNAYYHNCSIYELSALAFLNKPILSAYVVFHPRWRIEGAHKPEAKLPFRAGPQIKLSALRKHAPFCDIRKWT